MNENGISIQPGNPYSDPESRDSIQPFFVSFTSEVASGSHELMFSVSPTKGGSSGLDCTAYGTFIVH